MMNFLIPHGHQLAALFQLSILLHLLLLHNCSQLLSTCQLGLVRSPHSLCTLICCCSNLQAPFLQARHMPKVTSTAEDPCDRASIVNQYNMLLF